VQKIVRRVLAANHTPGVLVGIWSPRGTFVRAFGVADIATGAPLQTNMQFKIGSQTKAFVATLVLQLVGEGKVSLDDRISEWVEGVPNGDQITIRQLIDHTSGLGNPFPVEQVLGGRDCTPEELLALGASAPPVAPPGTTWSYSNYGYNLLGRVVELASGQDVSTAIQERIAKPLGLRRTLLPTSGNGLSNPFTHGYGLGEVGPTQAPTTSDDATSLHASCLWAAGGMVSTLSDLHVWSRALATGALLEPAVWREASKDIRRYHWPDDYSGPGRWSYSVGGFTESGGFRGKEGSLPGYESTSMYSPARKTSIVVVLTKQANAITPPLVFQALAMAVFGPKIGFGLTPEQALEPNYGGEAGG
jgi:D-alanyl-D-alanine carboxypeptidase